MSAHSSRALKCACGQFFLFSEYHWPHCSRNPLRVEAAKSDKSKKVRKRAVIAAVMVLVLAAFASTTAKASISPVLTRAIEKGCIGSDHSAKNIAYCNCTITHFAKVANISDIITWYEAGEPKRGVMYGKLIIAGINCLR